MQLREIGLGDVEAHDVDLDAEEGDFADAEAEELVLVRGGGSRAGAIGEGAGCGGGLRWGIRGWGGREVNRAGEERDCGCAGRDEIFGGIFGDLREGGGVVGGRGRGGGNGVEVDRVFVDRLELVEE